MTELTETQCWIKSDYLLERFYQIESSLKEEENKTNLGKRKRKALNPNEYALKLIKAIYDNTDLPSIAKMYLKDTKYNNDFKSSSSGAIFNAYLQYKKKKNIPYDYAYHIYYRDGLFIHNKDIIITVDMLIEEYDGNDGFTMYLKKIIEKKTK